MIARQVSRRKPLVVAQVEVGLGAVVGHEHFAVLIGRHRPRINIQVGIALLEGNSEAAALKQAANRCRRNALA